MHKSVWSLQAVEPEVQLNWQAQIKSTLSLQLPWLTLPKTVQGPLSQMGFGTLILANP